MKVDDAPRSDQVAPVDAVRHAALVGRLVEALIRLDAPAVLEQVLDADRRQRAPEVIGQLILPAARELHRRCRAGSLDAAAFAAGTALARWALSRAGDPAGAAPGGPKQRSVVVVAPPVAGGLDAEGAYESLLAAGSPAQLLVGVEDAEVLGRHLAALRPLAVVAASAEPRTLPAVAALAAIAGLAGVPVIAIGDAFGADGTRAASVGATTWVRDPVAMLEVLGQWRVVGGALPMNIQEPAAATGVRVAWSAVVMVAAGTGGPDEIWARSTLRALGEMLVASLWTGDVTVLLDWLDDELAGPDRTQVRDVHLVGLLDAVSSALPGSMEAASAMLGRAQARLRQHMMHPGQPDTAGGALANGLHPPTSGRPSSLGSPGAALPFATADPLDPAPPVSGEGPATGLPSAPTGSATPPPNPQSTWSSPTPSSASGPLTPGPAHLVVVPSAPPGEVAGQVFADLLLLGALSAQAAAAAVAVLQPGNRWSTLAHGLEPRDGLNDPLLWSTIAGRREAVEIADMAVHPDLQRSPLAQRPVFLRWAYGIALRDQDGSIIGVFCLLDRSLRKATRREQRTLVACARQLTSHLLRLRRPSALVAAAPTDTWAGQGPSTERAPQSSRRGALIADGQQLLRSHEVAVLFDVTERTVINWAAAGKLPSLRTIGGHLRFRSEDVYGLLSSRRAGA